MMCEDDIGVTSAGEGNVRVAQRLFMGSSPEGHPALHIMAVSGEIVLHHEKLYVQVCQPATGADSGILIRSCNGRGDYTGGPNGLVPLTYLDNIQALAGYCQRVLDRERGWP